MYEITFYKDSNGKSEVFEYIKELKSKDNKENKQKAKKIDLYIRLLQEYGLTLTEPYIKKVDGEIWELRPLRDRIMFASWCDNKFIMLSVFMKDTQKTPKREIEKAKRLLKEYKNRSGEDE